MLSSRTQKIQTSRFELSNSLSQCFVEYSIFYTNTYLLFFKVSVEVLEFPPLPPSPVEEADEESSDVGGSGCNGTTTGSISVKTKQSHAIRSTDYRPRVPPHRGISLDSSRDHHTGSLNTRSMDAAYARRRRMAPGMANRREVRMQF